MSTKLRLPSIVALYPILLLMAIGVYALSHWSIGLAISIGFCVQALIIIQVVAKAQRATVRSQDVIFKQYECLKQLYHALNPVKPLPNTRGYAASPDFLMEIYKQIIASKPQVIVEGSSGLSTLVSSYAAKQIGDCQVISLEHEELYCKITHGYLEDHNLAEQGRVCHAPIVPHTINGESWLWYDFAVANLPESIDLIVIDGPPKRLQSNARYPALPLLFDKLRIGGVLLMDDADRGAEVETAKLWAKQYPNIKIDHVFLEKGMLKVTKLK